MLDGRLAGLETGQKALEIGQATILSRVDTLTARDTELESKLAAAIDRMTGEMVKQQQAFLEAIKQQTDALRDGLIETRLKRRLIFISGRGMKWLERGAWAVLAAFGWKLWSTLAHTKGWDAAWWWPW